MRTRAPPLAVLFVLVGASLACGSGSSPSPPPDGGTAGGGSGGGGGGGSGGGDGDGSGGSGGGTAGPVTSADGSVTIERLDADAECDALVPSSASSAVTLRVVSNSCAGAISDGAGNVATAGLVGQGFIRWQVFTSAGGPEGTFTTSVDGASPHPLYAQPQGFQGLRVTDRGRSTQQVDVLTFSGDGTLIRTERATPPFPQRATIGWMHLEDPAGGTALVHFGVAPNAPCSGLVSRYDATGAPRGTGSYGEGGDCRAAAAAVSTRGEALVVEDRGGAAWLWWIGADGRLARAAAPAGSTAALFSKARGVHLAPLLDGSIVADEDGEWTRLFPYLGDHAEGAPGWLSSRPGFTFRNTRGAGGYALLPPIQQVDPDCTQRIELVAPSGRLCGKVTLKGDGGTCTTSVVDQGWDGTVIQRSSRDGCAWRSWPRLLAGG